jgi:serine/threonine protein kinase
MDDESKPLNSNESFEYDKTETFTKQLDNLASTDGQQEEQNHDQQELSRLLRRLELRNSAPATSISSFMALVAVVNPPFKPRTLYRPWSISAGNGNFGAVEVHRYVPGRNFDVFNNMSPLQLNAYQPDARRTGDYYAVKRLTSFSELDDPSSFDSGTNPFSHFADEVRILGHKDLQGHNNLLYLFGVSHSPSRRQSCLAEPNLVLQEGDCGDLFSFYRESDLRFNQQTIVEVKLSLCFDIASGLEALHRHGVVHCDLKPKNILLKRRRARFETVQAINGSREAAELAVKALVGESPFVAMLADFGGSLILSDTENNTMRPKVWTPFWAAPECYPRLPLSKEHLPRIDIYSAGLIFVFILLEGEDIFTDVVHRGMNHSHDVTMDFDLVKELKLSDSVLDLAKEQVRHFETTQFSVTSDDERFYIQREIMYPESYLRVFEAILDTCLRADPLKRVANATDMLNPWKTALHDNFHLAHSLEYQQPALFRCYRSGAMGPINYYENVQTCVRYGKSTCLGNSR